MCSVYTESTKQFGCSTNYFHLLLSMSNNCSLLVPTVFVHTRDPSVVVRLLSTARARRTKNKTKHETAAGLPSPSPLKINRLLHIKRRLSLNFPLRRHYCSTTSSSGSSSILAAFLFRVPLYSLEQAQRRRRFDLYVPFAPPVTASAPASTTTAAVISAGSSNASAAPPLAPGLRSSGTFRRCGPFCACGRL